MKILHVCSAREIGGGERYVADVTNSLAERGHQVFLTLYPNAPIKDELFKVPKENLMFSKMRNAIDVSGIFRLKKHIEMVQPQIVHAHIARDYPIAAIASRLTNTPFVFTRHMLFPLKKIQKLVLNNVAGIIAPSKAIAEELFKQKLFLSEIIKTIPYGININHFSDSKLNKQNKTFTIGNIGHIAPIKGFDTFIRAAKIVLEKNPNFKFVIVGEDKSSDGRNRKKIEQLISDLNLQSNVELVGWTDDIRPFLKDFDIFVSTARMEAFGLVMIEAMMSKTPVIATKSEGALEIIENEDIGILIEIDDVENLAKSILDLAANETKRKNLGEKGQDHVVKNYSVESMVDSIEEFYQEIINRTP